MRQRTCDRQRVRPTTRQSNQGAQQTAIRPRNIHFSAHGDYEPCDSIADGMTPSQIAKALAACLAVIVGSVLALDAFGWCIGHFMKGWW